MMDKRRRHQADIISHKYEEVRVVIEEPYMVPNCTANSPRNPSSTVQLTKTSDLNSRKLSVSVDDKRHTQEDVILPQHKQITVSVSMPRWLVVGTLGCCGICLLTSIAALSLVLGKGTAVELKEVWGQLERLNLTSIQLREKLYSSG